jgi:hypothetical protein
MKIADLQPDRHNARKATQRSHEAVTHSLKEFGAGRSILLDRAGRIIAGNTTAASAAAAGIEDVLIVPTDGTRLIAVQRTDLDLETDAKAKQLALADNRTAEFAAWNQEVLTDLSGELDLKPFFTDAELLDLGVTEPDFAPGSADDQGTLDEKKQVTCPECGHEFAPTS